MKDYWPKFYVIWDTLVFLCKALLIWPLIRLKRYEWSKMHLDRLEIGVERRTLFTIRQGIMETGDLMIIYRGIKILRSQNYGDRSGFSERHNRPNPHLTPLNRPDPRMNRVSVSLQSAPETCASRHESLSPIKLNKFVKQANLLNVMWVATQLRCFPLLWNLLAQL